MRRLLVSLLLAVPALAAEPVAPVAMTFNDILAPEMRRSLVGELAGALDGRGYELLGVRATATKLHDARVAPNCVAGPCLRSVGETLGVRLVLVGGVDGEGTTFDLHVSVLETGRGRAIAQAAERCDVCTFAEVQSAMRRLAQRVADQLAVAAPPSAPLAADAEVGAAARGPSFTWPSTRTLRWIALGAGVAAAAAGGYLYALEGDCANGACDEKYATAPAGMALLGLGTAALGGAGLIFVFGD